MRPIILLVLTLLLISLPYRRCAAGDPVYRTLDSPYRHPHYDVRQRTPYAYGWFGSGDHTHWRRHYGYHQNYTQWSKR